MKKTTLLMIGALAFVIQSASAQTTLYSDDFEGQATLIAPINVGTGNVDALNAYAGGGEVGGGNAGNGFDAGGSMWNWVGGGGNGVSGVTWQVSSVLDTSNVFTTQALEFGWTDLGNNGSWGFGFSTQPHTSLAAWGTQASLSDLTLSFDVKFSGTEFVAGYGTPVTVWADQFPGGKCFDQSYAATITKGVWNHVVINMANFIPSGGPGTLSRYYDPALGFEIAMDGGTGANQLNGSTADILIDNVLLTASGDHVPEPGTIALLTLGGLGALVAVRRRRA